MAVAAATAALIAGGVFHRLGGAPRRVPFAGARPNTAAARPVSVGPAAAVAAAYHYPLACLNVTISAGDPSYARARLDRASPCWRYGVYDTVIFHLVDGSWRQVLDANSYPCPVSWLPAVVQTQLSVCLGLR